MRCSILFIFDCPRWVVADPGRSATDLPASCWSASLQRRKREPLELLLSAVIIRCFMPNYSLWLICLSSHRPCVFYGVYFCPGIVVDSEADRAEVGADVEDAVRYNLCL